MSLTETLILVLYFFVLSILAIYGWHRYYLVYLYMKHKGNVPPRMPPPAGAAEGHGPAAHLQRDVRRGPADRRGLRDRLSARAARDPGPGRLDGRDDRRLPSWPCGATRRAASTSSTCIGSIAPGYKAGALEAGLEEATGEFIAIFDADFVPPTDFLLRTLPLLRRDPKVGMVQARWGHLNRDYSLLTQHPVDPARRALRARARRPESRGLLLQLQRHGRRLAPRDDRRRRRLAARHADRGSRPELPRAARAAGASCSCRTWCRRRKCRSR